MLGEELVEVLEEEFYLAQRPHLPFFGRHLSFCFHPPASGSASV